MENITDKLQLALIKKSKNYLLKCKKKNIDISTSPYCDLNTWHNGVGYEKLLLLKENKKFSAKFIFQFIKEIINIGRFRFEIFAPEKNIFLRRKKINLIYTYCWKKSFNKSNIFSDKYFNIDSRNKNFHFILNSLDGYIPPKKGNFTIILKKKIIFNPIFFLKEFFNYIFKKNFIHKFNATSIFCKFIYNFFLNNFNSYNFNLIIPYENRPHQNAALNAAKINKNKTYCYLHNMPWPFQIDMINKKKNIDVFLTSSTEQKKMLIDKYLWPKKIIRVIPSLRFSKISKRENTIFLPYDWTESRKKLIYYFKKFINKEGLNLQRYNVSIHPLRLNSEKHLNFKKQVLEVIKKRDKKNNQSNSLPIIFAHPGGTAAECLQTSRKAYHITCDRLNVFSNSIWKKVFIKEISDNVYKYSSNIKFFKFKGKNYSIDKVI